MGQRPFRVMSAAVACLAVSACAANSAPPPPPEPVVTVAVWGGDQDAKTYQQRVDLASDRVPGVNVKLLHIKDDFGSKIGKMIAEGNPPDIIEVNESVHSHSSKNQLLPLNPYIETEKLDLVGRFGERAARSYDRDGKTWALPDRNGTANRQRLCRRGGAESAAVRIWLTPRTGLPGRRAGY